MNFKVLCLLLGMVSLLFACQKNDGGVQSKRGYKVQKHVSTGGKTPVAGEYAYFHIVMRHQDSVLNSSYGSEQIPRIRIPAEDEFTKETPVIIDALLLMAEGDSATMFFPMDSLEDVPDVFAHIKMIEYDLKMLDIKTDEEYKKEMEDAMAEREARIENTKARLPEIEAEASRIIAEYKAGTLANVQKSASGLEYVVHIEGTGEKPIPGEMVGLHYYGAYMDGKSFDSSFRHGELLEFPLGQGRVIKAWDEGFTYVRRGSKVSFFIPPSLGYGETGYLDIPGNTPLYFLVEMEEN